MRRPPARWLVAIALAAGLATQQPRAGAQGPGTLDPGTEAKLTTVLADLARAVSQDSGAGQTSASTGQAFKLDAMPASVRDAVKSRRLRLDSTQAAQVYVLVDEASVERAKDLIKAGATIEEIDVAGRRIQARVPASKLQSIASLPFVGAIRLPSYAVHRRIGSVTSEGDAIMKSNLVRQQFGLDGTGVKVGVISDGLKGIFAANCTNCGGVNGGPIALGDLPNALGVRSGSRLVSSSGGILGQSFAGNGDLEGLPSGSCGFAGAGAEGTALLEIVHDIAPGAQLSFANADTTIQFNRAVNALALTNDVVVDDLGFFDVPFDGTSSVSTNTATALNTAGNRIRTYVTAVGNDSDDHYAGTYEDSGINGTTVSGITNAGRLHLFKAKADTTDTLGLGPQPFNVISLPQSGEVVLVLAWDEPAGRAANNYDVYLVRTSTNAVVARSTDVQSGSQDAIEFIDFVNTGATEQFRIVVQNVNNAAAPKRLHLFVFEPECATDGPRLLAPGQHARVNFNTLAGSLIAQGDAAGSPAGVISVGAICSGSAAAISRFAGSISPDESCNDGTHTTAEFFTSHGPTLDGRVKPEIAAIDGVAITGAGSFGSTFFGTSAAAPHVAGEAALVLQAASCLASTGAGARDPDSSRVALRNLILSSADPMSGAPPDNTFGFGRANALAAIQRTLPVFGGSPIIVAAGNAPTGARLTAADLGFTDPNQCPLTRVSWSGGCGSSPDSALNCPFGTSTVNVAASNSGFAFSAPTTLQVTVTSFDLVVTPPLTATINAGQSASFPVTVVSNGGAFNKPITLGCPTMPQGANCSFSPPAVIPNAGSVSSTLTITTTARAAAFAPALGPRSLKIVTPLGVLLIGLYLLLFAPSRERERERKRTQVRIAALGASAALLLALSACIKTQPGGPTPSFTPASLSFTNQGVGTSSAPKTVTLTNDGQAALAITSIAATGDFTQTNTCGASLANNTSCTIAVTFTPTALGSRSGSVVLTDNATGSPHVVSLSGVGGSAPGPTPAGTYTVAATGTSGTLTRSVDLTLVVR